MTHTEIIEILSDTINILDAAGEFGAGDKLFEIIQALNDEWGMNKNDHIEITDTETAKEYLKSVGAEIIPDWIDSYIVKCNDETYDVFKIGTYKGLDKIGFYKQNGDCLRQCLIVPGKNDMIYVIAVMLQHVLRG